jgi:hypothetical protein
LGAALRKVRRLDEAIAAREQVAEIFRKLGDRGEGMALNNLGWRYERYIASTRPSPLMSRRRRSSAR